MIVPVVKNADQKSLGEINRDVASVVAKAREGNILPDDVTGSTFTLTNTGTFGNMYAHGTPIINQPESAILQTGSIVERPAVVEGQVDVSEKPRLVVPMAQLLERQNELSSSGHLAEL